MYYVYEIYTKDPITGTRGWMLDHIVAICREDAATIENFDCIIMQDGAFYNIDDVLRSGLTRTRAVNKSIKKSILGW